MLGRACPGRLKIMILVPLGREFFSSIAARAPLPPGRFFGTTLTFPGRYFCEERRELADDGVETAARARRE